MTDCIYVDSTHGKSLDCVITTSVFEPNPGFVEPTVALYLSAPTEPIADIYFPDLNAAQTFVNRLQHMIDCARNCPGHTATAVSYLPKNIFG